MSYQNQSVQWSAPEYRHQKKAPDWFWAVSIVAISISIVSLLYNNVLFAIFILLGAFTLVMYAVKQPRIISFSLDARGIHIGNTNHPFRSLKSFWIHEYDKEDILIVESGQLLAPYIRIPIAEDISTIQIHNILIENLPEKEHRESILEKIMEYLGF